ncbi:MAG TPA: ABC transporter permease [Conexibacter sp.]|jgi:hypothetical protein
MSRSDPRAANDAAPPGARPGRRPGHPGWPRELLLGARLARGGGRGAMVRVGLTALGVALGVALLLVAASLPHVLHARDQRVAAREETGFRGELRQPAANTLLIAATDGQFRDVLIRGRLVRPEGPDAPIPPGLTRLPASGQLIVSPHLLELLRSPEGKLLRQRLPQPIVGTIGDAGLEGPAESAYYLGSDDLRAGPGSPVERIDRFGNPNATPGLDSVLTTLAIVVLAALLLPIAVFIAAAVRFGGEARDRRLAALRLLGADARMTRRIAAGEALVAALIGTIAGVAIFLVGRAFAGHVALFGASVFPADVTPTASLALAVLLGVPAAAVIVTLVTLRRVVIEPLGTVRRAAPRRRRLSWRLALPVLGTLLLLPLVGHDVAAGETTHELQLATGIVLVLLGVAALLPWLVESVVRRLGGGGVAWQLAIRRLQLDSGTSARVVSGIAVAVAGAIALQTAFSGVEANYVKANGPASARGEAAVLLEREGPTPSVARLRTALAATPGVRAVTGAHVVPETHRPQGRGDPSAGPNTLTITVRTDSADDDAIDRVRTTAERIAPLAATYELGIRVVGRQYAALRRGLFAGAVAVLLLIGGSMLVGAIEQLQERRRPLAALAAFGTPRTTVARSILWQTAIPIALGLALALATGLALGAMLLRMVDAPVTFDLPQIAGMTAASATVVVLVTVLSFPALRRTMRPEGLRIE